MIEAPEARTYCAELFVREVEATKTAGRFTYLEGRAVPYDTWADVGMFLESHARSSFKTSTTAGAGKRLPLLFDHQKHAMPIGSADSWTDSADGLLGVWRLNDSPLAQEAAQRAQDGDLLGLSIGFAPIRTKIDAVDDWNPMLGPDHKDRVTRLESRLVEVSLTPVPAFADAEVMMVRTAFTHQAGGTPQLDAWRQTLEGLRST